MFIDTHTHLYADAFDQDRDNLIRKAINSGISRFYMPNIDLDSAEPMLKVARAFPANCFPMMGLHPTSVGTDYRDVLKKIRENVSAGGYFGIGEIGIDLYWDKSLAREQEEVFGEQVQWAIDLSLPIVIHTRDSFDQVYNVLRTFSRLPGGIFHCFTGTVEQAEKILGLGGFKLGIGGVVTFKNSGLDKTVEALSLEHMVLETDAPYLAPVPFRGKRNEPSYLLEIAKKIAVIKDLPVHEVGEITSANALAVFDTKPVT